MLFAIFPTESDGSTGDAVDEFDDSDGALLTYERLVQAAREAAQISAHGKVEVTIEDID